MMKKSMLGKVGCLALAGMMTVGMGACSSTSSGSGTTAGSTAAKTTQESTAAKTTAGSSAAGTTEEKSEGSKEAYSGEVRKIIVGTGNSAAPFCYLDEDGNSVGYDIDVLKEIDERLEQYEFEIQAMDFSTLIVSIDSGSINFLSHQLVKSDARKEKYLFPEQYYCLSPMSLAVKDDSGIESMSDMAGKTMEQDPNAYEYQMLMAYNDAHPGEEIDVIAVADQSQADGLLKVSNGKVDASLQYKATFDSVVPELGIDNLKLTDVVMCEDTYMMFPKSEQQLCDDIDAVLKEMVEDGTLGEISKKWYGEDVFDLYADMISITAAD